MEVLLYVSGIRRCFEIRPDFFEIRPDVLKSGRIFLKRIRVL